MNADTIVEYIVTYERLDGRSLSLPGSTIFTSDDTGLVSTYRIYIDQTPRCLPTDKQHPWVERG